MSLDLQMIGIGMETSGLEKGTAALNATGQAAGRAADAADKASGSFNGLGGSTDKTRAATEKLSQGINDQIKKLQDQLNTFGMTTREVALYGMAMDGATKAQLAQAAALQKQIGQLDKAREMGEKMGEGIKAGAKMAAAGMVAFYGAVIAASVVFEKMIGNVAKYQDLAEQTGGDPAGLAALRTAADVGGTSVEALAQAAIRLEKNLSKVDDESKGAGKALAAIGLELDKFKSLTADEKLRAIGKALNNYADGGGKVAVIQDILGRGAAQLLPALKELGDEQEKSNKLTNEQIRIADDYKDNQARARSELIQTIEVMAMQAVPVVTAFIETIKELGKEFLVTNGATTEFSQNAMVVEFAGQAALALARLADTAYTLGQAINFLGQSYGAAGAVVAAIADGNFAGASAIVSAARVQGEQMKMSLGMAEKLEGKLNALRAKNAAEAAIYRDPRILGKVGSIKDQSKEQLDYDAMKDKKDKVTKVKAAKADPQDKADYDKAIQMQKLYADESKFVYQELGKDLEALRKRDAISEYDYRDKKNELALAGIASQKIFVEQEIAAAEASKLPLLARQKAIEGFQKVLQDLNQAKRAIDADYFRQEDEANNKVNALLDKRLADAEASTKKLLDEQKALRDEREEFGLNEKQLKDLTLARAEEIAVMLEKRAELAKSIDLSGAESAELQKQADLIRSNAKFRAENTGIKEMAGQWKSLFADVERGLTDSLFRAFESGKGFFKTLWDGIKNLFKTTALKLIINAVVGGVGGGGSMLANAGSAIGGVDSMFGGGGSGGGSGIGGMLSNAQSLFSGASNMVSIGSQVIGGTMSIANGLGTIAANATGTGLSGLLATNGAFGTAAAGSAASGIGSATAALGAIGPVGWAVIAGVAIAAIFGGGGEKETTGSGMRGTLGPSGASGSNYSNWKQDGGWFGSDSSGTDVTAADAGAMGKFTAASNALRQSTIASAEALGLSSEAAKKFSQSFDLATGSGEAAITALFKSFGDNLALSVAPELINMLKAGESAGGALTRLATSLVVVNTTLDMLGKSLMSVSINGGDAASKLADAFGGLDKLAAASKSFYDTYYTEGEKAAKIYSQVADALEKVGIVMPDSKEAFRDLALSMDLTTDAGRTMYATMLSLAPQFAASMDVLVATNKKAMEDMFGGVAEAFKNVLASIAAERGQVLGAMLQISGAGGARFMTPAQIRSGIAATALATPGGGAMGAAGVDLDNKNNTYAQAVAARNAAKLVNDANVSGAQGGLNAANAAYEAKNAAEAARVMEIMMRFTQGMATGMSSQFSGGENGSQNAPYDLAAAMADLSGELAGRSPPRQNANSSDDFITRLLEDSRLALNGINTVPGGEGGPQYLGRPATTAPAAPAGPVVDPLAAVRAAEAAVAAAKELANASNAYYERITATALAAKKAAETRLKTEVTNYIASMQQFAVDAGKAVVKLGKLREEVVKYYEAQKQLSELMLASAANLRASVQTTRFGQLTAAQNLAQQQRAFAMNYSMAMATTNETQAGYADKMAAALPGLSAALMDTSSTRAEWAIATGKLFAESETIATSLEANAPKNYAADSLALLGEIDAALVVLEAATKSAEVIIAAAIREGSLTTANGLHAVVAALTGQAVPAFASGGMFGGGLRIVGENGPELEATGPSRIFSAGQTRSMLGGDSGDVVIELRALREEVAGLRTETRAVAGFTNQTARTLSRVTRNGESLQTVAAA